MASIPISIEKIKTADFARGLQGFRNRVAIQFQPTGVLELDEKLGGGFPRGSIVELCGSASSGRTSLTFSLLAKATAQQETCAIVDVSDSLDPLSLAAAGVDLQRILWVRCGEGKDFRSLSHSSVFVYPKGEIGDKEFFPRREKAPKGHHWRHPREQIRGIGGVIPNLLREKSVEYDPTKLSIVAGCAGEQVERDRELPRRGIRQLRLQAVAQEEEMPKNIPKLIRNHKPWKQMEQGLRATELLLQSAGWGVVVLDLGGISWVQARKINLNLWFRFRRAIENTPTILLMVSEESYARTSASIVLHCSHKKKFWNCNFTSSLSSVSIFDGFNMQAEVIRSRVQSPPGDSACWRAYAL
jgi:recombination protein RecA